MSVVDAVTRLLTPEGRVDPYPTYEELRRYGTLCQAGDGFYVTTSYQVIDELLRDQRLLVSERELYRHWMPDWRPGPAASSLLDSMLQTNGPDHTRMRRLAAGAFTARRVAAMRDTIVEQATRLADQLDTGGPVEFMDQFAYPLPVRVICSMLGVAADDQEWFRDQAQALTILLEPQLRWEQFDEADAAAVRLRGYFTELVARRRDDPRDDLTTALVQAHDADGATLSGDELLANLMLLLVAGFETTTNLLGNGLRLLLDQPDLAAGLREHPELAGQFVEEILRFDPPVQLTARWSPVELTVAGVTIEPYAQILMLVGAGNRDPRRFAHADTFDPARAGNQPLSFGGGAHYCLGAPLARLEAQVALPLLLSRFPRLERAGEAVQRDRLTLRGYASLPVRA